jgi:hypothetical protein
MGYEVNLGVMKFDLRLLILLAWVIPAIGLAQVTEITEIEPQLTDRPWLDKTAHVIYGHKIIKVFGERPSPQRHSNLGSITTVAYLDAEQTLEKYGQETAGGALEVFLSRATQSRANFKWFFVVIRGEDDNKKIMEIDLDYQESQLPYANGWWNYTIVYLPEMVEYPFYVYINDRQSQHLSDFKFKVEKE